MRPSFSTEIVWRTTARQKSNSRLCEIGCCDPNEWDFPPKPKWMRWGTYHLAEENFGGYGSILDEGVVGLAARLGMRILAQGCIEKFNAPESVHRAETDRS